MSRTTIGAARGSSIPTPPPTEARTPSKPNLPAVRDTNQVALSPAGQQARMLKSFDAALGKPATVAEFDRAMDLAVRAAVGATPNAPAHEVYARFNTQLNAMPADKKLAFFERALSAAPYEAGEAKFKALEFFTKVFEIRRLEGNVIPPQDKTAHQFGPSGVVKTEATADAPAALSGPGAVVRMAPGVRGGAPGFSFIFPGAAGEPSASRVLMSVSGDYSANLSTRALGLKTDGPEGELRFVPSDALRALTLKGADGKPSEAWMAEVAKLPAGTSLGTLQSADPAAKWSVAVRTGDAPLATNMMGDRSLRFPRNVRPSGALGWAAWGTAAVLFSPVLLAREAYKAIAG